MSQLVRAKITTPSDTLIHDAGFQFPVTAGHVFASITCPAGEWHVHVNRLAYGAGQPSIANNSRLFIGDDEYTLATGGILGILYQYDYYVNLNGTTAIEVRAVGNGSANIGVTCGITATKLP